MVVRPLQASPCCTVRALGIEFLGLGAVVGKRSIRAYTQSNLVTFFGFEKTLRARTHSPDFCGMRGSLVGRPFSRLPFSLTALPPRIASLFSCD